MGCLRGIGIGPIQLGKPQQNAYVERHNRTVHYDWLGQFFVRGAGPCCQLVVGLQRAA
ncbi:MAG: transposase [Desulfovibrio alaskensis]|nr:transposase [Oleidesulfovibrio alaskensis]